MSETMQMSQEIGLEIKLLSEQIELLHIEKLKAQEKERQKQIKLQKEEKEKQIKLQKEKELEKIFLHESSKYKFALPIIENTNTYCIVIYTKNHERPDQTSIDDVYLFSYEDEYEKTYKFLQEQVNERNSNRSYYSDSKTMIYTYVKLK